jgi:hypothetical protein
MHLEETNLKLYRMLVIIPSYGSIFVPLLKIKFVWHGTSAIKSVYKLYMSTGHLVSTTESQDESQYLVRHCRLF